MDDTDWAVTGIFSPSKAKLAQAQAKDWIFVDSWLSKKYGSSRLPTFERNEETLQSLLALANLNEQADERRSIVERVEKAALQHYDKQKSDSGRALLNTITSSLDVSGQHSIETLAQSSTTLHIPARSGIRELTLATTDLRMQLFESQQAEASASAQLHALELEHDELKQHMSFLRGDALKVPSNLLEETTQRQKGVKHLRAKIGEYDERLATMRPSQPLMGLLGETQKLLADVEAQKVELDDVNDELNALQRFPRQSGAAKTMLEEAVATLQALKSERDSLLKLPVIV